MTIVLGGRTLTGSREDLGSSPCPTEYLNIQGEEETEPTSWTSALTPVLLATVDTTTFPQQLSLDRTAHSSVLERKDIYMQLTTSDLQAQICESQVERVFCLHLDIR